MAKVVGVQRVVDTLRRKMDRGNPVKFSVVVGYSAEHAIYVHENLQAYHKQGQAKYLEAAFRMYETQMISIAAYSMRSKGKTFAEAQMEAGEFVLEKSKELVPVDTGELRDSGFVRLEKRI